MSVNQRTGERDKRSAMIAQKSRTLDESTGRPYTATKLAELYVMNPEVIRRYMRQHGEYRFPPPKVVIGEVPENEKAFYMGMILPEKNYRVKPVFRGNRYTGIRYLVVNTESKNKALHELLEVALGPWGEVSHPKRVTKVVVDRDSFDFLLNPEAELDARFWKTRRSFGPFTAALLRVRLSTKGNRFSIGEHPDIFQKVLARFNTLFEFPLGRVIHRPDTQRPAVIVDERVIPALASLKSVRELPFFASWAKLGKPELPKTDADPNGKKEMIAREITLEMLGSKIEIPDWLKRTHSEPNQPSF